MTTMQEYETMTN